MGVKERAPSMFFFLFCFCFLRKKRKEEEVENGLGHDRGNRNTGKCGHEMIEQQKL